MPIYSTHATKEVKQIPKRDRTSVRHKRPLKEMIGPSRDAFTVSLIAASHCPTSKVITSVLKTFRQNFTTVDISLKNTKIIGGVG